MQEFPVDIAPEQILRWIKAELSTRPREFRVSAERDFVAAEDLDPASAGIGPDTDVGSVAVVGTVEIRSAHPSEEWVLQLRAEDLLGCHVPETIRSRIAPRRSTSTPSKGCSSTHPGNRRSRRFFWPRHQEWLPV